jgi:peroxiredoxin/mono/diheme cytochrome c family protein
MTLRLATTLVVMLATGIGLSAESDGIGDFALKNPDGRRYALSDFSENKFVVVAFLGTECPLAKLYAPRLVALAAEYESRGVAFLAVNSNSQDTIEEIKAYVRRSKLNFPLLKDPGARVADQFGAKRTPEVFVLDHERHIRYRGRIDDQYNVGVSRDRPTRRDLKIAIDELLTGKSVSQPVAEAVGCVIGRRIEPDADSKVTYSNQIARIFQKHCVECHRPGEIGPFSLTNYDDASGWSETIEEVIRDKRMPPWHADPAYGPYANQRLMAAAEKQLVFQWVKAGAPEGDRAQMPAPRKFLSGWRTPREPDQVVAMRERPFVVPAEGTVEYQYFVADPGFTEDKWISAAEVAPGNSAVVHHAIVFIRPPDGVRLRGMGWLAAYVPGQRALVMPTGQARRVPAGSKLIFQMHYTPTGSPQKDITKIGLVFAKPETVKEEVVTLMALNRKFEIPPNAENYRVESSLDRFPTNSKLLALAPHMHVRGKTFRYTAHRDGKEQVLLDVPNYDFNWQHGYRLANPLPLADVARIHCVAHFDNSENNLANPDPNAAVRWGDQTWQEMMIGFMEVAMPIETELANEAEDEPDDQHLAAAEKAAAQFIRRFDQNDDGNVERDEVPESFRVFAFGRFDKNRDRRIDIDEAREFAIESARRDQRRERDRRRSFLD